MTAPPSHSKTLKRVIRFRSKKGATLLDVRRAMAALKAGLIEAGISPPEISSTEIVVTEVLNNIVKHAQRAMKNGWFEIQCVPNKKALHFTCRDNGAAMPGGRPPGRVMPPIDSNQADLPEGGWGWALIRTLTTNLNYVRIEDHNLVSFNIPVSPPATPH